MSTFLVLLGLYGVQFLAALLALFLGAASVSPEIDSGALHAVLARPLSRLEYLLGRFLALAGLLVDLRGRDERRPAAGRPGGGRLPARRRHPGHRPDGPGGADPARGQPARQHRAADAGQRGGHAGPVRAGLARRDHRVRQHHPARQRAHGQPGHGGEPAAAGRRGLAWRVLPRAPDRASWPPARSPTGTRTSELPFGSTSPIAPAMLAWGLAYPVACLGLAVAAFGRRDL